MAKKKTQRQEPSRRRILFPREEVQPKKSEENIILALNETFQKARKSASICFSKVSYLQLGAISTFLTKKGDVIELLKSCTNILIRAAKTVDVAVISAEILEHW